jgi:hypothetical protein
MKNTCLKKSTVVVTILLIGIVVSPTFPALPDSSKNTARSYEKQFVTDNMVLTLQDNEDSLLLHINLDSFLTENIGIEGAVYQRIVLPDESSLLLEGKPELPIISRSIIVPDDVSMHVRILDATYTDYAHIAVAPSKGNLLRSINPDDIPYQFDSLYIKDQWFPEQIASLSEPYILRDFRGQTIMLTPFQYNPVKKTLRFYTDISLEIYSEGISQTNVLSRSGPPVKINTYFSSIYERHFLNYGRTGYDPMEEEGNMLVITSDEFWEEMVPFAEWKAMRGIATEVVNVSEIGDAQAIKAFISSYYFSKGVTFVLLVGDVEQVPTIMKDEFASDPSYSYIVGSDHYSDLFVGRFSAQTVNQLRTQITRTILYEKTPQLATWYQNGSGIGSAEGPGDDDEYDWEHIRKIRSDLLNYTYVTVDEFYDGTHGGGDQSGNPTPLMIKTALNAGRGIITYCGHGWDMGWGTSGFDVDDVNGLANDNMLPFIVSVACENGDFLESTCFAEAWLQAQHNNQPAGAIAAFMSSKSQSWNPPMDAQDEFADILTESYVENKKTTFGGLVVSGCMHMNDEYHSSGYIETDAWHLFGDPSLQVRTNTPTTMDVLSEPSLPYDATSFEVVVPGVQGALCTLSHGTFLFGANYTNETGYTTIEINNPMQYGDTVTLTATGYNKVPAIVTLEITGTDTAPEKPEKPTGTRRGTVGQNYTYSSTTTDNEEHQVLYQWDWGDGNLSEWQGPSASGQTCSTEHAWGTRGTYSVRVKAKDVYGLESDWSDPLDIRMPRDKTLMLSLLDLLEKIAPRLYQLLMELLGIPSF